MTHHGTDVIAVEMT